MEADKTRDLDVAVLASRLWWRGKRHRYSHELSTLDQDHSMMWYMASKTNWIRQLEREAHLLSNQAGSSQGLTARCVSVVT